MLSSLVPDSIRHLFLHLPWMGRQLQGQPYETVALTEVVVLNNDEPAVGGPPTNPTEVVALDDVSDVSRTSSSSSNDQEATEETTVAVPLPKPPLSAMLQFYRSAMFSSASSYGYAFTAAMITVASAASNYAAAFALSALFEEIKNYPPPEDSPPSTEDEWRLMMSITGVVLMALAAQLLPTLRETVLAPLAARTSQNALTQVTRMQLDLPHSAYVSGSQADRDFVKQKAFSVGAMGIPVLTLASEGIQSIVTIAVFTYLYGAPVGAGMSTMLAMYIAYCAATTKSILSVRENMLLTQTASWKAMTDATKQERYETMHDFTQTLLANARMEEKVRAAAEAEIHATIVSSKVSFGLVAIPRVGMLGLLLYAGYRLQTNQLTTAEFVAFLGYLNQLSISLPTVGQAMNQLLSSYPNFAFVVSKLIEKYNRNVRSQDKFQIDNSGIEFSHVTFSYPGKENILSDISLVIEPGKTVALVSRSGGGKSSLFNLLTQQYELKAGEGTILVGGTDISNVNLDSLRNTICLVRQDANLFGGSVIENIMYGIKGKEIDAIRNLPNETPEEKKIRNDAFIDFAMKLGLDDLVQKMNLKMFVCCSLTKKQEVELEINNANFRKGLRREVGEDGKGISGGERKKVAILRAFLAIYIEKPPIILLDEITANLDSTSAASVLEGIKKMTDEYHPTVITITHQLRETVDADKLYVIEGGKVVAEGTHSELMAQCPLYVLIWNDNQAKEKKDRSNSPSIAKQLTLGFIDHTATGAPPSIGGKAEASLTPTTPTKKRH